MKYIATIVYANQMMQRVTELATKMDLLPSEAYQAITEKFEVVDNKNRKPQWLKDNIKRAFEEAGGAVYDVQLIKYEEV